MRRRVAILGYVLALGLGSGAFAQGPLVELSTSDDGKGWEAVGRVNLGRTGYCTGTLIAPDLVLTAAHCLYDSRNRELIPVERIEFRAGWRNGRAEAYRQIRRAATHPDYVYDGPDSDVRVAYDLALLQLERPIRNTSIRPFATAEQPRRGDEVGIVSYATGRDDAPSLEKVCEVLNRRRHVLMLSCDVDYGASGAPIFTIEQGEARVVSVVSAKAEVNSRRVALAAELGAALETVRGQLDGSDGVFHRAPPPAVRAAPSEPRLPRGTATSGGAKFLRP